MSRKSLINQLELAYSPLSNFDFAVLKNDLHIQRALESSSLYIIAQRPELTFNNIRLEQNNLLFDLVQKGNRTKLKCILPIYQDEIISNIENGFEIKFGTNDRTTILSETKISNIHGIQFYELGENDSKTFKLWITPEKFLQNYWKGYLNAEIDAEISNLLNYKVHYVGKATKQKIWKRLTGHNTLQDILSIEYPFIDNSLPSHEIVILFYTFFDNLQISSYSNDSDIEELVDSLSGKRVFDQTKVFLDAEKALIKAMNPKHNKELFKNYPKSKDGLYNDNYDGISYSFRDPITLIYEKGTIKGCDKFIGADSIIINKDDFKLYKANE